MFLIWIGLAALLVFLGWGIQVKKWYFLISGYNTMSEEEQAQVDIEPFAKSIALMTYIMAALLLVLGVTIQYDLYTLSMIVTGLLVIVPFFFVIKGQKYFNGVTSTGSNKKSAKITTVIMVITIIFVGVLMFFSTQPTKYDVTAEGISISGMYGEDYSWDAVEYITFMTELPEIAARTNGSAVGAKLKGNFKFKNGEKAVLFVDKSVPAFIRIETDSKTVILNEPTVEETENLFELLQQQKQ